MRTLLLYIVSALLSVVAAQAAEDTASVKIAITGDSTVCDYPATNACRGWGQYISGYFQNSVQVTNLARSGRSTKTFLKEGLWQKTLSTKPNYILIQFGHNDSHDKAKPEATDAGTDFRDYLRRFIDEARAINATPILVTPMHRRVFSADGKLSDILKPYAEAMKVVAAEKKVGLIDLHTMSGELFLKLGDAGSAEFANAPKDRTHFNEKGARAMAALVMPELLRLEPRLKPLLALAK